MGAKASGSVRSHKLDINGARLRAHGKTVHEQAALLAAPADETEAPPRPRKSKKAEFLELIAPGRENAF